MKRLFARLLALLAPGPAHPPLVTVRQRFTGKTVEEALTEFEDACCDENFRNLAVLESIERPDGTLVRYEVRWKFSVFDDGPYSTHEAWARLVPADRAAGDSADARYCVAAATASHRIK